MKVDENFILGETNDRVHYNAGDAPTGTVWVEERENEWDGVCMTGGKTGTLSSVLNRHDPVIIWTQHGLYHS